jgi:copper transport protein
VWLLGLAVAATAAGLAAMTAAARADAGVTLADLLGSATGRWLLWRAAMLAAAGAAAGWLLARPGRAGPLVALGLAAGGGMLVHTLAGHAATPSPLRWLNLLGQWTHLLAVGVWIGGLAWLLQGLRHRATPEEAGAARGPGGAEPGGAAPALGASEAEAGGAAPVPGAGGGSAREAVVRFSRLAGISLAVVVATGVARTVDELGGWGRLVDSGFGRALDLKLVLFAGLVALGALNRYRLVPLFRAGTRRRAVARLRRSVRGELALAGGVLAAAALLSQLAPGLPAGAARPAPVTPPVLQATGADWATTVRVTLTVTPGAAGPNRFTATLADFDTGAALAADRVELTGSPAAHPGLAGARLELAEAADGRWLGQGRLLSLAGRWQLTTTIQRPDGAITVPLELDLPPPTPT